MAQDEEEDDFELPTAEPDLGSSREASRTDAEAVQRFVVHHLSKVGYLGDAGTGHC